MPQRRLTRRQVQRVRRLQEHRRQCAGQGPAADAAASRDADPSHTAVVVAQHGANLMVQAVNGDLHHCVARQHLGPLVCGDRVVWQPAGEAAGVVTAALPRSSVLSRPRHGRAPRPLAANVDQIAIVVAPRPELRESLIDRYLVGAELAAIPPLIVLNKVDLLNPQARHELEQRLLPFRQIGYPIVAASSQGPAGIAELSRHLHRRTTVVVGQSGVGKSSLARTLIPGLEITVGALSEGGEHGRHTTTTARLYRLPQHGSLIDSPGVRDFHLWHVGPERLAQGFRELGAHLGSCRFRDCRHEQEPGCAIQEAVDRGDVDARRLASYLRIRGALEQAR